MGQGVGAAAGDNHQLGHLLSVNLGGEDHLIPGGILRRIPVQVNYKADAGILGKIPLDGGPGQVVSIVIGGVIVKGPVVNHPDACLGQVLCQGVSHAYHVVGRIQRAVAGGLGLLGDSRVALGAVGVENQHRGGLFC